MQSLKKNQVPLKLFKIFESQAITNRKFICIYGMESHDKLKKPNKKIIKMFDIIQDIVKNTLKQFRKNLGFKNLV